MDGRDPQTFAIIGAAMEVHRELGSGFLERVYQEALAVEMRRLDIPFVREVLLPTFYKGTRLDADYRADFICFDEVVVELKAIRAVTDNDAGQVVNYLKATGKRIGLLLNFGSRSLQYRRLICSQSASSAQSVSTQP